MSPIVEAAAVLGGAIVLHGVAASVLARLFNPPLLALNPEFEDMPVIGPETEAIIESIGPRVQSAISAGVSSSLAAISSSLAEASTSQAAVASSLAAQDDADTAAAISSSLDAAGAPAAASTPQTEQPAS